MSLIGKWEEKALGFLSGVVFFFSLRETYWQISHLIKHQNAACGRLGEEDEGTKCLSVNAVSI